MFFKTFLKWSSYKFFAITYVHRFLTFFIYRDYYPQNIMFDRRVFRGSTNANQVIPAGQFPDQLFDNRKEKARAKA